MLHHFKKTKKTHTGKRREASNDIKVRADQSARLRAKPITLAGPNGTTISVTPKRRPR